MKISQLIYSNSWKLTKPLRWISRIARGDLVGAMDPIKKMLYLNYSSKKKNNYQITISSIKPTHPVAVILPVYRDIEMTERCILKAMSGILAIPDARIVAINDASPDNGMQEMLEKLATQWPDVFEVLENEKNLGFVGTVNRGLSYYSDYDVVLLNSDVIVPQDWLSRLVDEAYSNINIGTVTPFSNNATICSFPYFLQENIQPFNLDVNAIDAVFRYGKLPCIEAPTGVGFCMYIRRTCLEEIGHLNEEKFGKGYGEENDLCQRASKKGWLNIISPNIYAYHEGSVSFSTDKIGLVKNAMQVISEIHPNYHTDVQNFINHDPLNIARLTRYIQLLSSTPIPKVLHICHALGGGVKQHVEELTQYFEQSIAHLILFPFGKDGQVVLSLGSSNNADKLVYKIPLEYSSLIETLKNIDINAIHYHHTHGFDTKIINLPNNLSVPYLLTVHDFYWLFANPSLTDESGRYPGFYSEELRNSLYPLPMGLTVANWQNKHRDFINSATHVIFPSNATKSFFDKVYQTNKAIVVPHIEAKLKVDKTPIPFRQKDRYIIGILGALGKEKGADILERIAIKSKKTGLPFDFKLLGYSYRLLNDVHITGPYKANALAELIHEQEIDLIFFPAQWPETYSYTLSYALDSGLPIIAPNIGAFPERVSGRQNTLLFNHLISENQLINQIEMFITKLAKGEKIRATIFEGDISINDFYSNSYVSLVSPKEPRRHNKKYILKDIHTHKLSNSDQNTSLWRKRLLRILLNLYIGHSTRWIGRLIPQKTRRKIRLTLSNNSVHDILQE